MIHPVEASPSGCPNSEQGGYTGLPLSETRFFRIEYIRQVVYSGLMSAITFDTHAYIKKLEAVGVTEKQAEVQAQAISELVNDRLVTKEDLEHATKELEHTIKELEYRLVIRLGGMMVVAIGIVTALVKLL